MENKQPEQISTESAIIEVPAGSKVIVEKVITKDTPVDEISLGKLKLMPNWRKIFRKYSFIFTILAVITGLAGFILPHIAFLQPALDQATYGMVMFVFSVLAGAAQFFKQNKLHAEIIQVEEDKEE